MTAPPDQARELLARAVSRARADAVAVLRHAFDEAVAAADAAGDPLVAAEARIEYARVLAASHSRQHESTSVVLLRRAEELLSAQGDARLRARLHHVRGYARFRAGQPVRSTDDLKVAERLFREAGDAAGESQVLDTLGMIAERAGDPTTASLHLLRSLRLKARVGDRQGEAITLGNLGRLALHAGRAAEAERFLQEDLEIARELGDLRGQAVVHANLSECRLLEGRRDLAREEARRAIDIGHDLGDPVTEGFGWLALGDVERADGLPEAALAAGLAGERLFARETALSGLAHARLFQARTLRVLGRGDEALQAALGAARRARQAQSHDLEVEALLEAHSVRAARGEKRRARTYLLRAERAAARRPSRDLLERIRRRAIGDALADAVAGEELGFDVVEAGPELARGSGGVLRLKTLRFLGRGEFATVIAVEDVDSGRRYALKRLHKDTDPHQLVALRLRREFTAASRVPPGSRIVRPHAFGQVDGRPALLCDLVRGDARHGSLEELLDATGTLPPTRTIRLGIDLADGLAALHDAGVIHRDVKPSNVLLDDQGGAWLTDFGLVYDFGEDTYVAEGSGFKGSLAYIAPELCRDLDAWAQPRPATDLYSLGILLYLALVGAFPFPVSGVSAIELLTWKLTRAIEVPPIADCSDDLSGLLRELTAIDPTGRPSSARYVARRLRAMTAADR